MTLSLQLIFCICFHMYISKALIYSFLLKSFVVQVSAATMLQMRPFIGGFFVSDFLILSNLTALNHMVVVLESQDKGSIIPSIKSLVVVKRG